MPSNTNLNVDQITKRALMILHEKSTFIRSINRSYDDSFAKSGAKIGATLRIRLPNEYTVRTGAAINVQNQVQKKQDLTVATQKGVDVNFTSEELTMDIEDFSNIVLEPAISVLAANIEDDALKMRQDVYNIVDNDGNALTFLNILNGRKELNQTLTPKDSNRHALLSDAHSATLVDALKGLFNDQGELSKQYREGEMGRAAGFLFAESSLASDHTTGTSAKGDTTYNVNGVGQTGTSVTVDVGSTTLLKGDVITIAGCNSVHPETKVDTGNLQNFVITADSGASATSLAISPEIITSGGFQTVTASPTDNGAINAIGAGNAETLSGTVVYHKNAFTFATADLVQPDGVDFARREVFDGISMRIVRQYDINNDAFPCRIDVLYGYKTIRAALACRIHADG